MTEQKPHYLGHRQRQKDKLLMSAFGTTVDYELLEHILMIAKTRQDVKPLAKTLLAKYQTLSRLINTDPDILKLEPGVGDSVIYAFRLCNEISAKLAGESIHEKPLIESWKSLLDYCRVTMGHITTEKFRVLYLNNKNRLLADDLHEVGTVDHTPVYPREIVKRALVLDSSAVVLIHNHPSGDLKPSKADIEVTNVIIKALTTVNIELHDHVIISNNGHFSFRTNGVI